MTNQQAFEQIQQTYETLMLRTQFNPDDLVELKAMVSVVDITGSTITYFTVDRKVRGGTINKQFQTLTAAVIEFVIQSNTPVEP